MLLSTLYSHFTCNLFYNIQVAAKITFFREKNYNLQMNGEENHHAWASADLDEQGWTSSIGQELTDEAGAVLGGARRCCRIAGGGG